MVTINTNKPYGVLVAEALTRLTGDEWTASNNPDNPGQTFYLTRTKDGLPINAYAGNAGRDPWHVAINLHIDGKFEGDRLPYFSSQERAEQDGKPWGRIGYKRAGGGINIGHGKTAEQAAKDIIRRSLPMVEPAWAWVVSSLNESKGYHQRAAALTDELAAMAGLKAVHTENGDHKIDAGPMLGNGYGDINVYGDSVEMKLRGLSTEQARAVMVALATLDANKRTLAGEG